MRSAVGRIYIRTSKIYEQNGKQNTDALVQIIARSRSVVLLGACAPIRRTYTGVRYRHATRADTPSHAHLRGCRHVGRPVQPKRGLYPARRAEKCREFVGTVRNHRHPVRLQDLPRRDSAPGSEKKKTKRVVRFFRKGKRCAKKGAIARQPNTG